MQRLTLLVLALAICVAAIYLLARPNNEIDAASREKLEQVLEQELP